MKRFLLCLLALTLVLSTTGCLDLPTDVTEKTDAPNVTAVPGETAIPGRSDAPDESGTATEAPTGVPTAAPTATPAQKKLTIEEQVCFEHDGIKVTAVEVTDEWLLGTGIKFLIENNTDKNYGVSTSEVIINNCMGNASLSCKVTAGQKAYDTMYLNFLEDSDIKNPGQIEMYFYLYDPETYKTVYRAECCTLKTSLYDVMDVPTAGDGQVLYDKNGVRVTVKSTKVDQLLSSGVLLFLENNTDKEIAVSIDDLAVNGFMVSSFFLSTMYPGKCDMDTLSVYSSDMKKNNIETIETMTFSLRIYDHATYRDIDKVDKITIDLK